MQIYCIYSVFNNQIKIFLYHSCSLNVILFGGSIFIYNNHLHQPLVLPILTCICKNKSVYLIYITIKFWHKCLLIFSFIFENNFPLIVVDRHWKISILENSSLVKVTTFFFYIGQGYHFQHFVSWMDSFSYQMSCNTMNQWK